MQWFSYMERMENDRIVKRVYLGECSGTRSVGKQRKRWIDTMKDCLKKRCLDVHDKSVQQRFVRGNPWGVQGKNP